ncbi:MAG: HAMP domain-containing protein [Proteobacteria bacterium]|nr:HAMP domain-containing protein [Pseudomonadota bacterium]
MTIRVRILAIATLLILTFAIVTGIAQIFQERLAGATHSVVEYHIPISTKVAEIGLTTSGYELNVRRLVRNIAEKRITPEMAAQVTNLERESAAKLTGVFKEAHATLSAATADPMTEPRDKVVMARLDGAFDFLERGITPFLTLGSAVLDRLDKGQVDEAARMLYDFKGFEELFGPNLAEIRGAIDTLTANALQDVQDREHNFTWIAVGLFLIAAALGLVLTWQLGRGLQRALHLLIEGTRAVESGRLDVDLHVTSKDEIGELTRAFNVMVERLREKERIKDTFGKFVDPRIVAGLISASGTSPDMAERKLATTFFSDIKGFSHLGEQLTAAAVVKLLNRYFTAVTHVIHEHHGVVDKYIGDAVMAYWMEPFTAGDRHAAECCLAALDQQRAIAEFRRELPELLGLRRDVPEFAVRMGIATGDAVVGTIGSDTTKSFTIIGDMVNLASRLEGANKVFGTSILISVDTCRLAQHVVETREIDVIVVAGKTEPIRIFEVLAKMGELTPVQAELCERFAEGLAAYRNRDWEGASSLFDVCLRAVPGDGPSQVFRQRVERLRELPPPQDWDGVWRLSEK